MIVRRRTVDGSAERQMLTAAAVSGEFLEAIGPWYNPELVGNRTVRILLGWCIDYHSSYGKAPGRHLKDLFDERKEELGGKANIEMAEDLLADLSEEYQHAKQLNVQFILDACEKQFKRRSLELLALKLNEHVASGDMDAAEVAVAEYRRVRRPTSDGANPFKDPGAIADAFEREGAGLFTVPGKLGRMINRNLNRDQFVGIMAPEKRGKTWWLNELAIRAAKARCNVALFQIGDMSRDQVIVRLGERLVGKTHLKESCGKVATPVLDCKRNQNGTCPNRPGGGEALGVDAGDLHKVFGEWKSKTKHVPCCECKNQPGFQGSIWWKRTLIEKPCTWREAYKAGKLFLCRIKGRDFRLSVHPSESLTVTGIKAQLDVWAATDGFVPDVIVIDYADNLAPENPKEDVRHQINRTWKLLRGLSQERHSLVATATQVNAKAYGETTTLGMQHFSENHLKFAHVTGMYGLNQNAQDKQAGIMRVNVVVQREGEFHNGTMATVGMCLAMGRPLLFSF